MICDAYMQDVLFLAPRIDSQLVEWLHAMLTIACLWGSPREGAVPDTPIEISRLGGRLRRSRSRSRSRCRGR